ncbi:MAG: hypothetical protein E7263_06130 [Lachnospiraceae bacterium]|nr:hypothetical protein [Lachnospiraceae bacterium]
MKNNMEKVERKYLAHFIDAAFGAEPTNYTRLGKDLEEYNIDLNPDGEEKSNILGESSYTIKGYKPSGSVDTYYAYDGEPLFEQLAMVANERKTGSDCMTTAVDVLVDSKGVVIWAYREDVVIVPQSVGGDTGGVQIPFEIHYNGNRVKGTWDMSTKTFTPDGEAAAANVEQEQSEA